MEPQNTDYSPVSIRPMSKKTGRFEPLSAKHNQAIEMSASPIGVGSAPPALNQEQRAQKIVIVESSNAFASYLMRLLEGELKFPLSFSRAAVCQEAISMVDKIKPNLIVMDMAMGDCVKAAERMWALYPSAKILFWSDKPRETYFRDLALAAIPPEALYGFVIKTSADDRIIYAVASLLLHSNVYIDPSVRKFQAAQQHNILNDTDLETLADLALGLTDKAMSQRRLLSLRGVQNRISTLYKKILFLDNKLLQDSRTSELVNMRVRLVFEAMKRGLITADDLARADGEFNQWMSASLASRASRKQEADF